jgi:hypothetical protein
MANYIVKIDPNLDAYVYWNTERDAPDYGGTREQITDFLQRVDVTEQLDERFARADATGTSAKPWKGIDGAEHPGFFAWAEPGDFVAEQRGLVKRSDLMELWRCVAVNRPYPHILSAFPDGHIVGWHEPQNA